ncbi:hypothetical protein EG328_011915 [Venturia inaequalis]|uniref:Uncharacterized protein n=1 Tax=Venturia inaequalis TaxID=5025 RepID=A0A8H3V227_VENIN|nr:hypothetical protein EG328_011915 [Venturia inaequalis]
MKLPESNRPRPEEDTSKKPEQNPSDPLHALFNSLFALPKSIYNRGNEHGRALTRRQQYKNNNGEAPRPRSARRECARWEGQGYRGQDSREEQTSAKDSLTSQDVAKPEELATPGESKIATEVDEWVQKIIGELERGEKEARQLYEQWMAVSEVRPTHQESARETSKTRDKNAELTRSPQATEGFPWSGMFPFWPADGHSQGGEHGNSQHIFTEDIQQHQGPRKQAEDVDETIEKLHKDFGRWLSDADRWRERFQKGFERDARLWQDESLFGSSVPFSKPLSTLFSLGMRPFLPEQSAVGYLLYSEYSPLHLEHEEGFDSSFRQRFEDLLRCEDGKAMMSKEECASGNNMSSVDWLGRLIPFLKEGESSGRGQVTIGSASGDPFALQVRERQTPDNSARLTQEPYDNGPATEQDMYEQHFSNFPREPFPISSVPRSVPQEPESRSSRPSILSTMTRTERHVAPDGSVTTKTVLKKSFADGSEENWETTETTPATRPAWREQRSEVERGTNSEIVQSDKPRPDQEPSRGWFWSS